MSKFPDLFFPALGGTALVLGLAVTFANRNHGADKIEALDARVAELTAQASDAQANAGSEAARAASLEARISELETQVQMQAASAAGGSVSMPAPQSTAALGLGRPAHPEEIAAWDVDVLPDGRGLPEGRGDVFTGEEVFADACAACHGDFAEGVDNWPALAGGFDTLADEDPVKTVGSYWPYLSTVWDYVHRSMPFGAAQTLTDDEVYAIVAYILYSNDLVDDDFELSHENFADVQMHNSAGFVIDDRSTEEYVAWSAEPCMENCKDSVEVTMRASILDVTPEEEETAATSESAAASESAPQVEDAASIDPALVAAGEKVFRKCKACHEVGAGAKNKSGPHLTNIVGRVLGSAEGFKYSAGFKAAGEEGRIWTEEELVAFLAKPKDFMKGTKMSFAGLKKETDLEAILAYLASTSE